MSIIEANEPEIIESSNFNKSDDKLDEDVYFGDEEINGNSKELNDGTNGKSNELNNGTNGKSNELNDGTNGNFNEPYETPPKKVKTSPSNRDMNSARTDYLDWDEYFMAIAFLSAKRSKDPVTQVGACIVNRQRRIVGIGYNGMPTGCGDADFPWGKKNKWNKLENKYLYVCHAEMNAILNKNASDVRDCRMYVALFPCNECAKLIIQAGISEVVYMSDKHAHKVSNAAAKRMFNASNVKYWQYVPKNERIVIDFSEIDWNAMTQLPDTDTPAKNGNLEELQFSTRPKTMKLGD